jgi:Ca2+-binding EF-hand superfamily protein
MGYNFADGTSTLGISAELVIPGNGGSDGIDATAGAFHGGWFAGADFSEEPEELVLIVDNEPTIRIDFNHSATDIDSVVAFINIRLGGAAIASVNVEGGITITSVSTGGSSRVTMDNHTGDILKRYVFGLDSLVAGQEFLGPPRPPKQRQFDGQDATSGTLIGERVPHTSSTMQMTHSEGWDFTNEGLGAQELLLDVDGETHTIMLETDLTDPIDVADTINATLGGTAVARVSDDAFTPGNIVIQSATTGYGSTIRLNPASSTKAKLLLAKPMEILFNMGTQLDAQSQFLRDGFPNPNKFVVYVMENQTGLLISDSVHEGYANADGTRKCASAADNPLIRASAFGLESDYLLARLDASHSVEVRALQMYGSLELGPDLDWVIVVVETMQCGPGQQLAQRSSSVECTVCQGNTFSADGSNCSLCPVGLVPNEEKSSCVMCPKLFHFDVATEKCLLCATPTVPNADRTSCICPAGTFNHSKPLSCFEGDYAASSIEQAISSANFQCHSCANLEECVQSCRGDDFTLKPGWTQYPHLAELYLPIFRCRAHQACPGATVNSTGANTSTCANGYIKPACGSCDDNHQLKPDGSCQPCRDTSTTGALIVILVTLAVLALLAISVRVLYNYIVVLQEIIDVLRDVQLKAMLKVVLSLMQIVGTLAMSLGVAYPENFRTFLAPLMNIARFDLVGMLGIGCVTSGSYVNSLIGQVVILGILGFFIFLTYLYRHYKATRDLESGSAEIQKEICKEIFDRFDTDGDGIELAEVELIMKKIEPTMTAEHALVLFEQADTDGSGCIDFEEFFGAVRNLHS